MILEEQALEETLSVEETAELFCNTADVLLSAIAFENRFNIVFLRQRRASFIRSLQTILVRAYSRCAGGGGGKQCMKEVGNTLFLRESRNERKTRLAGVWERRESLCLSLSVNE